MIEYKRLHIAKTIRFDEDQFEEVRRIARKERRGFGAMVRLLIDEARASRNRRRTRNQEQAA